MQKAEVIEFEMNLSEELVRLQKELEEKRYQIGEYYKFTIYDPKKREIQALPFRDRIVQHFIQVPDGIKEYPEGTTCVIIF